MTHSESIFIIKRDESQIKTNKKVAYKSFILNILSTYQKRNTVVIFCKFWEHKRVLQIPSLFFSYLIFDSELDRERFNGDSLLPFDLQIMS